MSYRVRYTKPNGETGLWLNRFTNEAAAKSACSGAYAITGYTYSVEPDQAMGTAAVPDTSPDPTASAPWPTQAIGSGGGHAQWPTSVIGGAGGAAHTGPGPQPAPVKPALGIMPRRVWEEQRIRALAEAIVRRMGNGAPTVASVFDFDHVRDWAAEIVELCERMEGSAS